MSRYASTVAVVGIVLLAGCLGGSAPSDGSVSVYVSDEQNAIEDFDHLNVTITKVGLKRAGGWQGDHSGHDHGHRQNWVVYDIPDRTVDLTRLQGENATLLETVDVANGTYKMVFIEVAAVNGTLKNASQNDSVDVRLPSDHLKVRDTFTVEGGDSVSFVVDVTVVERDDGYVIKPRVSQSGADQPFCRCQSNCTCGGMNGTHSGGMGGNGTMHGGQNGSCTCS